MKRFSLEYILNVVGELFSDEVSIAISDKRHYLYYRPSKRVNLKIKTGDPIKKGTITDKALSTQKKVSEYIDRDVIGVPYDGQAVPLFDKNGELIGCITAIYPTVTHGKSVITVKTSDGWVPIPFPKVLYIEAKERKTYVYSKRSSGTHKFPLQELEYILPNDSFIRCHRSYIVNVNQIVDIFPDTHSTFILVLTDGSQIPVSQSYSSYFRKLLSF